MKPQELRDAGSWTTCPPGTLQDIPQRVRAARRQAAAKRIMAPLFVLFLIVTAAVFSTSWRMVSPAHGLGGISCADVQKNLGHYASGQLQFALSEQIAAHLQNCPFCQARFRSMNSQTSVGIIEPHVSTRMLASKAVLVMR